MFKNAQDVILQGLTSSKIWGIRADIARFGENFRKIVENF